MDIIEELEAVIRLLESGVNVEEARGKIVAIRDELISYSDELAKNAELAEINAKLIDANSELVTKNRVMRSGMPQVPPHKCQGCGQMTAYFVTIRPSSLASHGDFGLKERVYKCTNCPSETTEQIPP